MTNVVALRRPLAGASVTVPAVPALTRMFATGRRDRHDAFWLKENAEILQILAATGVRPDLSAYAPFVDGLMAELRFFPQYYRLFLSIALDLRVLGMPGVPVDQMAAHIVTAGLAEGELSDTHRAEAALLLARAGVAGGGDAGLQARLARFSANPARFAVPNLRAAYDLTHLVFHAADYGRRTLEPDPARASSLIHAGIVAFLDDNMDLLAEITIALRLGCARVPKSWDRAVAADLGCFAFLPGSGAAPPVDDYHAYLVQNWAVAVAGGQAFAGGLPQGTGLIVAGTDKPGTLRALSLALMDMGERRRPDWSTMRWRLWPTLSAPQRGRLAEVEEMTEFAAFFAAFARCGTEVAA